MKKYINAKLLYRKTFLIVYDVICVVIASYLAVYMRYEMVISDVPEHFTQAITQEEMQENPRSKSSKLRIFEKI